MHTNSKKTKRRTNRRTKRNTKRRTIHRGGAPNGMIYFVKERYEFKLTIETSVLSKDTYKLLTPGSTPTTSNTEFEGNLTAFVTDLIGNDAGYYNNNFTITIWMELIYNKYRMKEKFTFEELLVAITELLSIPATDADLSALTIEELHVMCKTNKLSCKGKDKDAKDDLVQLLTTLNNFRKNLSDITVKFDAFVGKVGDIKTLGGIKKLHEEEKYSYDDIVYMIIHLYLHQLTDPEYKLMYTCLMIMVKAHSTEWVGFNHLENIPIELVDVTLRFFTEGVIQEPDTTKPYVATKYVKYNPNQTLLLTHYDESEDSNSWEYAAYIQSAIMNHNKISLSDCANSLFCKIISVYINSFRRRACVLIEYHSGSVQDDLTNAECTKFKITNAADVRKNIYKWLLNIAKGIECMHKNRIVHLDVTPCSITIDDSGNAKIIDVSSSLDMSLLSVYDVARKAKRENRGNATYMAPELFYEHGITIGDHEINTKTDIAKCDVFSLGVTFAEVLFRMLYPDIYAIISNDKQSYPFEHRPGYHPPKSYTQLDILRALFQYNVARNRKLNFGESLSDIRISDEYSVDTHNRIVLSDIAIAGTEETFHSLHLKLYAELKTNYEILTEMIHFNGSKRYDIAKVIARIQYDTLSEKPVIAFKTFYPYMLLKSEVDPSPDIINQIRDLESKTPGLNSLLLEMSP